MKEKLLMLVLAFSVVACSGDYDFKPRKYRFQTLPQAGEKGPVEPPQDATYITCAEFPDGYDYHADPDYGQVEAKLLLFVDGERTLSLPAGPGSSFSIDPDMHRVRGGHLYTDGVDAKGTFVHRDGEQLFRYEGRESLRGFLLLDGKVHTLGQSRSGEGFSYRINGEMVYGRTEGYILGDMSYPVPDGGALRVDNPPGSAAEVYFSYGIPHPSSSGTKWEYHIVRGGVDEEVDMDATTVEIYDIVIKDGQIIRTERRNDTSLNPVLVIGKDSYSLGSSSYLKARPHICRIFFDGDELYVKGWFESADGEWTFTLWTRRGITLTVPGRDVYDIWVYNGERFILQKKSGELTVFRAMIGGVPSEDTLGEYSLPFNNCAVFSGGNLSMAFSHPQGELAVYSDGRISKYKLYGYPTSIRIGL